MGIEERELLMAVKDINVSSMSSVTLLGGVA